MLTVWQKIERCPQYICLVIVVATACQPNRIFSNEIKNCYLPVVRPFTTKSVTFIRITATNRQERCISGVKLLPSPQLIKWLVG